MKKHFFLLVVMVFLFHGVAFSQFAADPNDQLYRDLSIWEGRGIVRHLPVLRPYPPQVLIDALKQVVHRGTRQDAERAQAYLEELEKEFRLQFKAGGRARSRDDDYFSDTFGRLEAGGWLTDSKYLNWRIEGLAMDNTHGFLLPAGQRTRLDIYDVWADITLMDRNLNLRTSQVVDFSMGSSEFYFSAGIKRASFGPFWGDSVVLSPDAPHAGHYSVVWRNEWFSFTNLLLSLIASNYLGVEEPKVPEMFPNKFLVLQSINFYLTPWLELGYFQTVVYGDRFDVTYLLPFKELFYAQALTGFEDNSFMGFLMNLRVQDNIRLPIVLYIDDAHLNEIIRFNFDTKFKVALQAGIQYTTKNSPFLRRVGVEYVLVTPYTYTHRSGLYAIPVDPVARIERLRQPNFTNYTHMGTSLGIGLNPNSDRISLSVELEPIPDLTVKLIGRHQRHGNASEGVPNMEARNDGTILDDGHNRLGRPTFNHETRFLTQEVIERIWQGGVQARYQFPLGPGSIVLDAGYTVEYYQNKGLVRGLTDTIHYVNIGLGFLY